LHLGERIAAKGAGKRSIVFAPTEKGKKNRCEPSAKEREPREKRRRPRGGGKTTKVQIGTVDWDASMWGGEGKEKGGSNLGDKLVGNEGG